MARSPAGEIKRAGVTLLDTNDSDLSNVSPEEAARFLEDDAAQAAPVAVVVAPPSSDEEEDMWGDLE
jgi:hypothetical protein